MISGEAAESEVRFSAYVEGLSQALEHRDREEPFRAYCAGLLGTEGRKSVEPLAAATAPARVSGQHQSLLHFVEPISVKELALGLPDEAWRVIEWREGTNDVLEGRFARVRVHAAHRDNLRSELRPEEWLVIEWPETEAEPTKYWLSTLPEDIPFDRLVDAIKLRWRIERDYQELKQEVGLGHYEGRGWRGFHHHATLCIAAYGFLISEKETIPPSGHPRHWRFQKSAVSRRPRSTLSASAPRAPRAKLHRNSAPTHRRRAG